MVRKMPSGLKEVESLPEDTKITKKPIQINLF